jgi:hypothetical protein
VIRETQGGGSARAPQFLLHLRGGAHRRSNEQAKRDENMAPSLFLDARNTIHNYCPRSLSSQIGDCIDNRKLRTLRQRLGGARLATRSTPWATHVHLANEAHLLLVHGKAEPLYLQIYQETKDVGPWLPSRRCL